MSEETPAVVLDTGEPGDGRAVRCGCHLTAEACWVDASNRLLLGVPAVSVQRDAPRINPGPNSELFGI